MTLSATTKQTKGSLSYIDSAEKVALFFAPLQQLLLLLLWLGLAMILQVYDEPHTHASQLSYFPGIWRVRTKYASSPIRPRSRHELSVNITQPSNQPKRIKKKKKKKIYRPAQHDSGGKNSVFRASGMAKQRHQSGLVHHVERRPTLYICTPLFPSRRQ